MAERKTNKGQSLEYQGPSIADGGFDASGLPPNPSDAIFLGAPLPTMPPQAMTMRRSFTEPTRSPLHYSDGPGTDEAVTSRRPAFPAALGNIHEDIDHTELRPIQGQDKNRYSQDRNDSKTLNGAEIYGT